MNATTTQVTGALLGVHAQTSLHFGAGAAMGTVDLPIFRERCTQWPSGPSTAGKGVLRDLCREHIARNPQKYSQDTWFSLLENDQAKADHKKNFDSASPRGKADSLLVLNELFGPPTAGADTFAGALTITDMRLIAFPVRSAKGVFAWITCPEALRRLQRDADLSGCNPFDSTLIDFEVPQREFVAPAASREFLLLEDNKTIVLEEFDFAMVQGKDCGDIAKWIAANLLPQDGMYEKTRQRFEKSLVVLADTDFTHFVRNSTEVNARIGLDYETKTVKRGALFYQELLPPESLLYSVLLVHRSRARASSDLLAPLRDAIEAAKFVQMGGDETTGKGICALTLSMTK